MSHLRATLAKGRLRPTQGAGPLSTLRAGTGAGAEDSAASGAGGEPMDGPGRAPGSIHRLSPCAWSLRAFPRRGRREGRCEAALEDGAGRGGPQPLTCPIGSLTPMSKAADIGTRERPSPAKGRRARADFHGGGGADRGSRSAYLTFEPWAFTQQDGLTGLKSSAATANDKDKIRLGQGKRAR